jgi:hypothetical protein
VTFVADAPVTVGGKPVILVWKLVPLKFSIYSEFEVERL